MWFWARAGAGATCIYTTERWVAGMTFESVPENVWIGIAATCAALILVGDTVRWCLTRRKEKAAAVAAMARKAEDDRKAKDREELAEAERREVQELLRDVRSENVILKGIKSATEGIPQEPLGKGHTCARLPDGISVVTLKGGSMKLALPVRAGAGAASEVGYAGAGATKVRDSGDQS